MTAPSVAPASATPCKGESTQARRWVFCILALLFALFIWPTPWSYHSGQHVDRPLVRRNRISGEVQILTMAQSWSGDERPATWQPLVIKPLK